MIRIGSLFLPSEAFQDEANQTIGAPAFSDEVIGNRRNVTSRLTPAGQIFQQSVIALFKSKYKVDVVLRWNIHCGCTMCPCSPGFNILLKSVPQPVSTFSFRGRLRDEQRFNVWVKQHGRIDCRVPERKMALENLLGVEL